jgi:hypothetical protein
MSTDIQSSSCFVCSLEWACSVKSDFKRICSFWCKIKAGSAKAAVLKFCLILEYRTMPSHSFINASFQLKLIFFYSGNFCGQYLKFHHQSTGKPSSRRFVTMCSSFKNPLVISKFLFWSSPNQIASVTF